MKITQQYRFKPVTITLETQEEAQALFNDLQAFETYLVCEDSEPKQTTLTETSRVIMDMFTDVLMCVEE